MSSTSDIHQNPSITEQNDINCEEVDGVEEGVNKETAEFTIESVFQELHYGIRAIGPLSIHEYLQKAISKFNVRAVRKILLHYPLIIAVGGENDSLPLHNLFDICFKITNEVEDDSKKLALLVKNVKNIMKILIHHGVQCGVHKAGGLLKLNKEKIDFVNYRYRTPITIFLIKFESILNHYREKPKYYSSLFEILARYRHRQSECKHKVLSEEDNAILLDLLCCIEYCIQVVHTAWKEEGCQDSYTIMHSAIDVFPLLKVETMKYLIENVDCHPNKVIHQIDKCSHHPLEFRDSMGRTVLAKAVYAATKRRQMPWGDWKERFHLLLDEKYNGFKQCWIRDKDRRLPIHIAVLRGLDWKNGLQELIEIDSATLLEPDPLTGLLPFMEVASRSADLNLTIQLLQMNPPAISISFSSKSG